ncbi:hypothetical protein C3L50_15355 [Flavobacterium alvei]|uniref:Uncharacterized protein n=1 Tax=Flavobacterium alvei TaxID=2080416 RepID=A0A2S5A313_9FLAO|nr:hypothetical protein C3L50_15355 [Flavobacterium alvei]
MVFFENKAKGLKTIKKVILCLISFNYDFVLINLLSVSYKKNYQFKYNLFFYFTVFSLKTISSSISP